MTQPAPTVPEEGQFVQVRGRMARIVGSHRRPGVADVVLEVEYVDGGEPERETLVWSVEAALGASIADTIGLPPPVLMGFDAPEQFDNFLASLRWKHSSWLQDSASGAGATMLLSGWRAAVQIEGYQLFAVLKALSSHPVRILLADDVGLGKTIEAGLILSELIARRNARRILVVCPASLQFQWRDELWDKFGLDFAIVSRQNIARLQREYGTDVSPWLVYPRVIVSMDYLRQRDVCAEFLRASKQMMTRSGHPWDVLVVDEAHHFMPLPQGQGGRRGVTERIRMLRNVVHLCEHRIFLTATPHNGYTSSFTGLLELLDPVRFIQRDRLTADDKQNVGRVMLRRMKQELNERGLYKRFVKRTVEGRRIDLSPEEAELFEAVRQYRRVLWAMAQRADESDGLQRQAIQFLISVLTKRLLSSTWAFARTWWQHVEGWYGEEADFQDVQIAVEQAQMPLLDEEEVSSRELSAARQAGAWLRNMTQHQSPVERVSEALRALGWTQEQSEGGVLDGEAPPDAKWDEFIRLLDERLRSDDGGLRDDERLIVFAEYKDTVDYLMWRTRKIGLDGPAVQILFGGCSDREREAVKEEFNDRSSPLRILVATDVASEGLNLHLGCRYVLHWDIPWNPMRLDQRNGRVDRHGQEREVTVWHFFSDEEADIKFLDRVVKKVDRVRADLGSVGEVIDEAVRRYFLEGEEPGEHVLSDDADDPDTIVSRGAEREDLQAADETGAAREEEEKALQSHRAAEMRLALSPDAMARLVHGAMQLEGAGSLEGPDDEGCYRIEFGSAPGYWRTLADRHLLIRSGPQRGGRAKLVFDDRHLVQDVGGRRVFRPKPDRVLVRLGHPIVQHAISVYRRRLWMGSQAEGRGRLSRMCCRAARLGGVADAVLVAYALVQAVNELGESIHEELIDIPLLVDGQELKPADERWWHEFRHQERSELPRQAWAQVGQRLHELWPAHRAAIEEIIAAERSQIEQRLHKLAAEALAEEKSKQEKLFDYAAREARREMERRQKREIHRQMRKLRRQLEDLQQEIEQLQRQPTLDLGIDIHDATVEEARIKKELEELEEINRREAEELELKLQDIERQRQQMLGEVLPRRFSIERVHVWPAAVEYIVDA